MDVPLPFARQKTLYTTNLLSFMGKLLQFTPHRHIVTPSDAIDGSILFSLQPNKKTKNAPKIANARPPVTSVKVRRVKSAKGNIREQHDLIVNIDLVSTTRPRFNDGKLKYGTWST